MGRRVGLTRVLTGYYKNVGLGWDSLGLGSGLVRGEWISDGCVFYLDLDFGNITKRVH